MLHGISASISKSAFAALALTMGVSEAAVFAQDWEETVAAAAGQTVFFNAWGGDERINAYIAWAGDRVREDFGVTVQHVKLADTAEAVNRVRLEQQARQDHRRLNRSDLDQR